MMSRAAYLILHVNQGITDEQFQGFLELWRQERWEEAARQLGASLTYIADSQDERATTEQGV